MREKRDVARMYRTLTALALLGVVSPILADTYLCVGEAAAGVEHGGKAGIKAHIYNPENEKYVMTNGSGAWVVKALGEDDPLFDDCKSEHFCERKGDLYAGTFVRYSEGGTFTAVTVRGGFDDDPDKQVMRVATGRCSKL